MSQRRREVHTDHKTHIPKPPTQEGWFGWAWNGIKTGTSTTINYLTPEKGSRTRNVTDLVVVGASKTGSGLTTVVKATGTFVADWTGINYLTRKYNESYTNQLSSAEQCKFVVNTILMQVSKEYAKLQSKENARVKGLENKENAKSEADLVKATFDKIRNNNDPEHKSFRTRLRNDLTLAKKDHRIDILANIKVISQAYTMLSADSYPFELLHERTNDTTPFNLPNDAIPSAILFATTLAREIATVDAYSRNWGRESTYTVVSRSITADQLSSFRALMANVDKEYLGVTPTQVRG